MKSRSGISAFAVAAAAGALSTYFLDSAQGARRRAVVRDKVSSAIDSLDEAGRATVVDVRNRAWGTFAALRRRVVTEEVPDDILVERVRAQLGRAASHPGSIEASASQGAVTLRGPVLKRESKRVVRTVGAVPGVRRVIDQMETHEQQGDIPGLQGGKARVPQRADILQERWSPATRALVGGSGVGLIVAGLARRAPASPILVTSGIALLVRAATNLDWMRVLGQRGRRAIDYTKTMRIAAPLDLVFAFWSNFENFPRFMRNVRSVRRNADGSWHWEVAGPLGKTVQWDAIVTQHIADDVIAWATVPGAQVEHGGLVRFEREDGGTRVQIQMTYNPPAGALGHVVASLFGADPGAEMDEDLMRLKNWFETGRPARDAAARRYEKA
jgi:uncharacterized membrane protein